MERRSRDVVNKGKHKVPCLVNRGPTKGLTNQDAGDPWDDASRCCGVGTKRGCASGHARRCLTCVEFPGRTGRDRSRNGTERSRQVASTCGTREGHERDAVECRDTL